MFARCGIDVGKGFASAFKAPRQLSTEPGGRPPEFAALPAPPDTKDPAMLKYLEKYRERLKRGQLSEESTQ